MADDFDKRLRGDAINYVIESKGSGCVIPTLDPFDEEAMTYERVLPPSVCEETDWVDCFMDKCFVTQRIREKLNVSCVYRDLIFVDSSKHHLGHPKKLRGHQKYILKQSDHVHVTCHDTNHRLSPPPPSSMNKKTSIPESFSNIAFGSQGVLKWSGLKTGLRRLPQRKQTQGSRLNVLMLCFNAISKNGFIRKMPKSHAALKKMGAVILNGYNILEDLPSAAPYPIFTGNLEETRKSFTRDLVDEDSFIFSQLSRKGYRTAFFEDTAVLSVRKNTFSGFEKPPTDHYLLPFLLRAREACPRGSNGYCVGDVPLYGLLLNLTYQFSKLEGNRFSFTFISDIGHEEFSMRSAADEDLAWFLRRIQQAGILEDTMLFVMGDHGPRLTPFRETRQGKYEERLPLMAIVIPERLHENRPEAAAALVKNVDVLTTPFDIHTTLTDLLLMEFRRNRFKVPGADMERGQSLLKPAGVSPYWCACAVWQPLDHSNPHRKAVGGVVADYINSLTHELRKECLLWKLVSIEEVLLLAPRKKLLSYRTQLAEQGYFGRFGKLFLPQSQTYQAKIVMAPGRAIFESTLKYFPNKDLFVIAEDDVSRINSYANESACLTNKEDPNINKFCYCKKYVETVNK